MTDLGAACLLLGDAGAVNEGAALLPVLHVAFLLEDTDSGEDRVIGQRFALRHGGNQIGDGGFAAAPEDLHEPELSFGQRIGFLWWHLSC